MDDPTKLTDAELQQRTATAFSAAANTFFRNLGALEAQSTDAVEVVNERWRNVSALAREGERREQSHPR